MKKIALYTGMIALMAGTGCKKYVDVNTDPNHPLTVQEKILLAPIEFNHVVGLYIATLFVVWQIVNFVMFRTLPDMPILVGGALIVAGGLIVTFWK